MHYKFDINDRVKLKNGNCSTGTVTGIKQGTFIIRFDGEDVEKTINESCLDLDTNTTKYFFKEGDWVQYLEFHTPLKIVEARNNQDWYRLDRLTPDGAIVVSGKYLTKMSYDPEDKSCENGEIKNLTSSIHYLVNKLSNLNKRGQ